jgi:hypothetical protein
MIAPTFNRETVRLGRVAPPSGLILPPKLSQFQTRPFGAAPLAVDWCTPVTKAGGWRSFLNTEKNCCTVSAAGNMLAQWSTLNTGTPWIVSDNDIIDLYGRGGGYKGTPETDNGAYEGDVLAKWSGGGWDVGRQDIDSVLYAPIDPADLEQVRQAVLLFGGVYIALALPESAETQGVWSLGKGLGSNVVMPGSWGEHATYVPAYDERTLTNITWGFEKPMTWEFFQTYGTMAWAVFSRNDWLGVNGHAPSHYDFDALSSALTAYHVSAAAKGIIQ